ncbi:Prenylcysteine lyase-domain-containing protein [Kockovaella imperatae]|uniref:Prenylcysteine lyase-domain-containing protein n=1 Tax=Kockovaella imperatae TaxID=4999 RepID=A0A1Y1UAT7_9TREE|nr:Prenylcysteine lyase-domain-containing protein [Kockovaella imperatae]ORX34627.1 Prenylcysteine lyase-domain-containing protein [Kockovaella imperatae]
MLLPAFCSSRPRVVLLTAFILVSALLLFHPSSPAASYSPATFNSQAPYSGAGSFPIFDDDEDWVYDPSIHHAAANQTRGKRIAIIGAGASGSSAAWFIRRAGRVIEKRLGKQEGEVLGEIVIYDKEPSIGGRTSVVYPHNDTSLRPVELGASIFVDSNRHLVKATKRFNLKTIDPDFGETGLGIWDGTQFLYTSSISKKWYSDVYDTVSALRRYGPLSPYRTRKAVGNLLSKFANLYHPTWLAQMGPARDVETFVERVGLGSEYTVRKGAEWATGVLGLGQKWVDEIMEGSTRVNYASNMVDIHALGAAVSMATGGAKAVEGGNYRIFEEMVKESGARTRLGEEVFDILPQHQLGETPAFEVRSRILATGEEHHEGSFDQVFYAMPWYHSSKDYGLHGLQTHAVEKVEYQRYVHLFVTYFTTTRDRPVPSFFGLPEGVAVPNTILTSSVAAQQDSSIPPPRFQSITWHGETKPGSGEYIVKVFSQTYLKDHFIRSMIDEEPSWLVRKEWNSYPELRPRTEWPPVEPVKGVQYLASLEPWISTMETQTLSAREAVARVVYDWWGLGYGECKGGADAWDWSCEP